VPVLLVSRGSMSGGQIIAQCLAHTGGFRCVTREHLIDAVNRHGECAAKVTAGIEKAAREYEKFSELRRPYKILMRLALLDYASSGNLAYFGYSGHLLVEEISHFVRVRLLAPTELRIKTTRERLHCSEAEARDYIRNNDAERTRWARFMYGKNVADPRLYDVCINMDKLSFSAVCTMLTRILEEKELQPSAESLAALEDLHLAARIEAALVMNPQSQSYEIAAAATKGAVRLEGPYLEAAERSLVIEIAASVPGAGDVEYVPGYVPDLDFLP
jgi:hypothetical protein